MKPGRARILALALGLLSAELLAWPATRYLAARGVLYRPSAPPRYDLYLAARDPLLGWPSPQTFGKEGERDARGARLSRVAGPAALSVYGDSFAWGSDVSAESCWVEKLGERMGARTLNFGVGGYGTDQAVLRHERNVKEGLDDAPRALLVIQPENVLRNLNRYRALLYPGETTGFKPRFVLREGALVFLPMPDVTGTSIQAFVRNPMLEDEWFLPGGPAGIASAQSPPFTLALLRATRQFAVVARLAGEPRWAAFFRRDHPSGALPLLEALVVRFRETAGAHGQEPLVVVLPPGGDLVYRQKTGAFSYAPLLASDPAIVNLGERLQARLAGRDPCTLFVNCSSHYSVEGNAWIVEAVSSLLVAKRAD